MASQLRELRNQYGTGHGRAVVHDITDEVIEACVHGALLWVRWALARLQAVLLGPVWSCDQCCDPRCRIQRMPAHNSSPAW